MLPEEDCTYVEGSSTESAGALEDTQDTHNQLPMQRNEALGHEKDLIFPDIVPIPELHAAK